MVVYSCVIASRSTCKARQRIWAPQLQILTLVITGVCTAFPVARQVVSSMGLTWCPFVVVYENESLFHLQLCFNVTWPQKLQHIQS
jgi:hypothetical protein